jgi:MFS superfamily sulfate permease-like transporter
LGFRNRIRDLRPQRSNLKSDFVAGLTFAIVSVPQAMAHALLAAVNPVLGIYTLIVAVPVAAIFTSSVFMNVSTTAALSVVAGNELAAVPPAAGLRLLRRWLCSSGCSRWRPDFCDWALSCASSLTPS